jgi:hypothetical protein
MSEQEFFERPLSNWKEFVEFCDNLYGKWIFRGQANDWDLQTRLERACEEFDLLDYAAPIEFQLIREFRRRYKGDDCNLVHNDTLYCLALMQHHGAPTRLLDCTYSPFVAAYFALETKPKEERKKPSIVYCFNNDWLDKEPRKYACESLLVKRSDDDLVRRDDESFKELYMSDSPKKFVSAENAFNLNERLIIQKGVFLCPGMITDTFLSNLKQLGGWHNEDAVIKVKLKFDLDAPKKALEELHNMNVNRATLFPGLDGFTESLRPRLPYFYTLKRKGRGKS